MKTQKPLHERIRSRREIIKLHLKQKSEGVLNPKEIKTKLGYSNMSFVYRVIRDFEKGM